MDRADSGKRLASASWRCPNVWAAPEAFSGNEVRQLVVPASEFREVVVSNTGLRICNNFGSWPATAADQPRSEDLLWARLPAGTKAGDSFKTASWCLPPAV